LDAFDCVLTKLDVREFDRRPVPPEVKMKVLEAGRASGTGMNVQHLRFILVDSEWGLKKLAADSTTGGWVAKANFAVVVLSNPKYGFHLIDAGRALQNMQIAAWNYGVTSCIFTGFKPDQIRMDFSVPKDLNIAVAVGFGYPTRKLLGKKNRKPLEEIAHSERFGTPLRRSGAA